MKSSSSAGPRRPAFSEFWLSATGTPWLVVSTRLPESARTRSSGPLVGLNPTGGAPDPSLVDGLLSLSVLPVVDGSRGSWCAPGLGLRDAVPYSSGLLGFSGMAAARSPVSAILRVAASSRARGAFADGPLTVERAEELAGPLGFDFGGGAALRLGLRLAISIPRLLSDAARAFPWPAAPRPRRSRALSPRAAAARRAAPAIPSTAHGPSPACDTGARPLPLRCARRPRARPLAGRRSVPWPLHRSAPSRG